MSSLMRTFESLDPTHQAVAHAMSQAARQAMAAAGLQPLNDDHAARFDEACACYLQARLERMAADADLAVQAARRDVVVKGGNAYRLVGGALMSCGVLADGRISGFVDPEEWFEVAEHDAVSRQAQSELEQRLA